MTQTQTLIDVLDGKNISLNLAGRNLNNVSYSEGYNDCLQHLKIELAEKLNSPETVERVARAIGNCICKVSDDAPPSCQISTKPTWNGRNGWVEASKAAIAEIKQVLGV